MSGNEWGDRGRLLRAVHFRHYRSLVILECHVKEEKSFADMT